MEVEVAVVVAVAVRRRRRKGELTTPLSSLPYRPPVTLLQLARRDGSMTHFAPATQTRSP